MSVFGPILHPGLVEEAIRDHLRAWMPTYLKEIGTQHEVNLAPVGSYTIVSDYDQWPAAAPPVLVIENAGLADRPVRDGEGKLSGVFSVEVTVALQGPDADSTRRLAMLYGIAVVAAMMQQRRLAEGIVTEAFVDSAFAGANVNQRRTRIAVAQVFLIRQANFLDSREGPVEPEPAEIPEDWPQIKEVEIDLEPEEIQ